MYDNIISEMTSAMKNDVTKKWLARMCDSDDNTVSPSTVFLIIVTIIGCILLLIPAIILLVEIYYNHTIATDLNGLAAYVTSVVALFATGGLTKAWTHWATKKYESQLTINTNSSEGVDIE